MFLLIAFIALVAIVGVIEHFYDKLPEKQRRELERNAKKRYITVTRKGFTPWSGDFTYKQKIRLK